MSTINIPGFTAEKSLHRANEKYFLRPLRSASGGDDAHLVHPARFVCWRGVCACSGDDDCNGMFLIACKDGGYARCWIRGPGGASVFCICS